MPDMLHHPITDASAWRRADLERDEGWVLRLTPPQQAEVRAAERALAARGLRGGEFTRADFPLPTLEPQLAEAMEKLDRGRGLVLLKGLPVDRHDEERAARILWGIGLYFGRGLKQIPRVNLGGYKDNLIAHIVDQGFDYSKPNVTGSSTSAEQMPHVDGSDVVALLCLRPAADGGGVSRVVSSMAIHNTLLAEAPDVLEQLYEGFHHDLRGDVTKPDAPPVTPRIPVFSFFGGVLSCNFNSKTVEQAAAKLGRPLAPRERTALDTMLHLALDPSYSIDMAFETGDLQLVNNYTVMHSRTAWVDPPTPGENRLLFRLWLKSFPDRPLAPAFSGGYTLGAVHDTSRASLPR